MSDSDESRLPDTYAPDLKKADVEGRVYLADDRSSSDGDIPEKALSWQQVQNACGTLV